MLILEVARAALGSRYRVEEPVGRGGMAVVCRAIDLQRDRPVAIKILYPDLARAMGGARFLREIGLLATLSHPNILPLLDSGTIDLHGLEVPWYTMPFVEQQSLRTRLLKDGALPIEDALRYATDLCGALAHAHGHGIIHRDIKPENILLLGDRAVLADFGIARAISIAGGPQLSTTGLIVGTPAYMSPEQAAGDTHLDPRSDLYSLGVVFYEMLAGHQPFTGSSAQAIGARHQFETPPPVQVVRPSIPDPVRDLLDTALAKIPGDRFPDASTFARAIERAKGSISEIGAGRSAGGRAPARSRKRFAALTLFGGMVVLGLVAWLVVRRLRMSGVDPDRVVVLPFQHVGAASGGLIDGVDCATLINDALERWPDLRTVDGLRVQSSLAARGMPATLAEGERLARALGAGVLIWGQVFEAGDSTRIQAVLYQVRTFGSRTLARYTIGLPGSAIAELSSKPIGQSVMTEFLALTRHLVVQTGPWRTAPLEESFASLSIAALRAKLDGDSAMAAWDLTAARKGYHDALRLDPGYPQANLSLAQLEAWASEDPERWRGPATLALAGKGRLTPRQTLEAQALVAMAAGRFQDACTVYREMIARDSTDFTGWFGLGQCLADDPVVVEAPGSPSGWAFRSSYREGLQAYMRAMELIPLSVLAYQGSAISHLVERFYVEHNNFRLGHLLETDSILFGAFPVLNADTIGFVPRPLQPLLDGQWPAEHPILAPALAQRTLLATTASWIRSIPENQAAWRAHALALELSGMLSESTDPAAGALGAIRHARGRSGGKRESIELATSQVRILVKLSRFGESRALADSILEQVIPVGPEEHRWLAGLAALTGRVNRAAQLARGAAATEVFPGPDGLVAIADSAMKAEALALLVYASFGGPGDSLRAVDERLRVMVHSDRGPEAEALLAVLRFRAMLFAFPLLGPPGGSGPLLEAEQAIARGDTSSARQHLDALRTLQANLRPGDRGMEGAVLEARLRLAISDTASATSTLDGILRNLSTLGWHLIDDLPQSSSLGLGMSLSQNLGVSGTPSPASLDSLWSSADGFLR
jgi:hypothetical protein